MRCGGMKIVTELYKCVAAMSGRSCTGWIRRFE